MKLFLRASTLLIASLLLVESPHSTVLDNDLYLRSILAVPGQTLGATGFIKRMIVNHNANDAEIFITTDDPSPNCSVMIMRTSTPNIDPIAYNVLYTYILSAKLTDREVQFYTDSNCRLFRAEIVD